MAGLRKRGGTTLRIGGPLPEAALQVEWRVPLSDVLTVNPQLAIKAGYAGADMSMASLNVGFNMVYGHPQ